MRALLLAATAAVAALAAAPAQAQFAGGPVAHGDRSNGDFRRNGFVSDFGRFGCDPRGFRGFRIGDDGDDRDRRHRRDRRVLCDVSVGTFYEGGEWALYNNRTFEPDSYNDWWHDRPDRSFPRWTRNNQNCEPERMWWSGAGWRC